MLTLDEAIAHCKEKTGEQKERAEQLAHFTKTEEEIADCLECAREHEQLAEWLKELRKLKKCRECPLIEEECKLCGFKEGGAE